jgi:uncharacterized alpha-E superfamily protein
LDVHFEILGELGDSEIETVGKAIFDEMNIDYDKNLGVDMDDIKYLMIYNSSKPTSICGSLLAAHENAAKTRESINVNLWECVNKSRLQVTDQINNFELKLKISNGENVGALSEKEAREKYKENSDFGSIQYQTISDHDFLAWIRERVNIFDGIVSTELSEDQTKYFLRLGEAIESIDIACRLISLHSKLSTSYESWKTVLKSTGGQEGYLRSLGSNATQTEIINYILLSSNFPASLLSTLVTIDKYLEKIDLATANTSAFDTLSKARRLIGNARATLKYEDINVLSNNISNVVATIQNFVHQANDAIYDSYFYTHEINFMHNEDYNKEGGQQ